MSDVHDVWPDERLPYVGGAWVDDVRFPTMVTRPDIPRAEAVVTYGGWEVDPDVAPVLRMVSSSLVPWLPPQAVLQHSYRRAVYRHWVENGREMGSWDWERAT